jgi:hypothetical protein
VTGTSHQWSASRGTPSSVARGAAATSPTAAVNSPVPATNARLAQATAAASWSSSGSGTATSSEPVHATAIMLTTALKTVRRPKSLGS